MVRFYWRRAVGFLLLGAVISAVAQDCSTDVPTIDIELQRLSQQAMQLLFFHVYFRLLT